MTLVLSMNPFLEPEREPHLSTFQPGWKTQRCSKTCLSRSTSPSHTQEKSKQEPSFGRLPDQVSMSTISFFKRKFVDDDEASFSFRTYCQTVAPVLEERAHVLRLSLEKMRFIDDPEAFLRRSVLVNNLLRRLRTEILLQSTDWCFPANPLLTTILPPGSSPTHQALSRTGPTPICLPPQAGPPFRKRLRTVRAGPGDDCAQTCCCLYTAGHYLPLPLSVYQAELASPHSSSVLQTPGQRKFGLSAVEGHDGEGEEMDHQEVSERRQSGPVQGKSKQKSRTRSLLGRTRTQADCARTQADCARTQADCARTQADHCLSGSTGEEEEGELQEDEEVAHCEWNPEDLLRVHYWYQRGHRQ
ncbi:SERTA domain-containing protein 4-like [Nerophis lumbriciformis]|uniref:SERTA domain-containing protein 4-like n=1 Tax=Nerophis lumbriciformis TaxID=546530 RepID=UPI002ADFBBB5|nr:SERTA domain-containing protein 4-like [Nerophis lumbriciformis]XP_061842930.1 SERTA domain-containing protein 4-like [Nerophis lumbriciformis]XP_061842931.1 SERTA domain-containing protein 4-like [Nerophis lumbriciformis]XP_061842932.1 SERTA domain-containing protein 4-like [Nerophis lumbriciformis]